MLELKVKFKTIWGKERFQPVSEDALTIARLIGKKTLTRNHLLICKAAGWSIKIPNVDMDKFLSDQYEV